MGLGLTWWFSFTKLLGLVPSVRSAGPQEAAFTAGKEIARAAPSVDLKSVYFPHWDLVPVQDGIGWLRLMERSTWLGCTGSECRAGEVNKLVNKLVNTHPWLPRHYP